MIWWWPWIHWIIEKAREVQKNTYFCFIDYAKAFDCVDHDKLQKILKEMGIPNFTCVLRNLYAGQETTVRTIHGKKKKNHTWNNGLVPDWERSTSRLYIVTLFIQLICRVHHAKCWAGIKIAGRNIIDLRYADDTTLMAESEEELKSLLMKVKKESEKPGLKLNILNS